MTREPAITLVARGPPALRGEWMGDLARLVANTPVPAFVLLEASSGDPEVVVTTRPRSLVDALRRSPASAAVHLVERTGSAPAPPAPLGYSVCGLLLQAGRCPPDSGEGDASLDRIGIGPTLGRDAWLGLQTFWVPNGRGRLWLARRFRLAARDRPQAVREYRAAGTVVAADWTRRTGVPATPMPCRFRSARRWATGDLRSIPRDGWFERTPEVAARTARSYPRLAAAAEVDAVEGPAIVFGASGAGKTTYLARTTAARMNDGEVAVVVDVHGDLAPSIVARLGPTVRRRVVSVDAGRRPVSGVSALGALSSTDRVAAHLVAALKRLSPDGVDLYWGFRLERVFDSFVRLALDGDGTLVDVYDLLTNPTRRDAARLATRSGELARFLDELGPIVRRNPEFLWSAATRLSKVVLVPALRELLAPVDGGLPVETLLARGRSLLVRLPFTVLGPEAATFAATLVLGRVYLGVAAEAERRGRPIPVHVVLDEVHAVSPRLVTELLTEGRKFGVRTLVATQYPARLAREVQSAARGALRGFVAFRVPRPAAIEVGGWLGLSPEEAVRLLPDLPTGRAVLRDSGSEEVRAIGSDDPNEPDAGEAWQSAVTATRAEFPVPDPEAEGGRLTDSATEQLLLAAFSAGESGRDLSRTELVDWASSLPGGFPDRALLANRVPALLRSGCLEETGPTLRLTPAGERQLGLTAPTQATRESAEHRFLLLTAFRLFARRGYRLEIVRQGRFDTTLPDARFRQLPELGGAASPAALAEEIGRARNGWAWRFFGGRDVFVEAEVSGALRAERVRHGVRKALAHDAFVLFVVGDSRRARRIRAVLGSLQLPVGRAQVWTLRLPGVLREPSDQIGK